jgi:hypothetical protein
VANGNGFIFKRLVVDCDTEGRADCILTAVTFADAVFFYEGKGNDFLRKQQAKIKTAAKSFVTVFLSETLCFRGTIFKIAPAGRNTGIYVC